MWTFTRARMNIIDTTFTAKRYLCWRTSATFSELSDPTFYERTMGRVYAYLIEHHVVAGVPSTLFFSRDEAAGRADVGLAMPFIDRLERVTDPDLSIVEVPPCRASMGVHYGPHEGIGASHAALAESMKVGGLRPPPAGLPYAIEEYVVHSRSEKDSAKHKTNIYYLHG